MLFAIHMLLAFYTLLTRALCKPSLNLIHDTTSSPHKDSHSRYSEPSIDQTPHIRFEELWDLNKKLWDNFLFPANSAEAREINSTVFAEDVLGRVQVTRTFPGRELNTEYVFGLFSQIALNPKSFTLLGYPINYTITHFTANQNILASNVIVYFNITSLNVASPIDIDFWGTYNSKKQLSQYDATFKNLGWQFEVLFDIAQKQFHLNSTAQVQALATKLLSESICKTAMTYCNGTNQQYKSLDECKHFLTYDVRFGQSFELGMNTLLCRMVHQNMVPFRPDVHCPHIGPTGGGYCNDDRTYNGMVLQPYFVNAPFVPFGKPSTPM